MEEPDQNLLPQAMAVTGCIGSGKSKVARWLGKEWGIPVFDADEEVRVLLSPGQQGWLGLKAMLDATYFDGDSRLINSKLRQAIFTDATLRQAIEEVIHPLVLARLKERTAQFTLPCLVEVPLLYEVTWQYHFAKVLVVHADARTCIERVMARDGASEAQALAALRSQGSIQEKIALADFVVNNSGVWEDTISQLETIKRIGRPLLDKKNLDTRC